VSPGPHWQWHAHDSDSEDAPTTTSLRHWQRFCHRHCHCQCHTGTGSARLEYSTMSAWRPSRCQWPRPPCPLARSKGDRPLCNRGKKECVQWPTRCNLVLRVLRHLFSRHRVDTGVLEEGFCDGCVAVFNRQMKWRVAILQEESSV